MLTICSAGSLDSDLTQHGHNQATRLGQHFQATGVEFTHIFSSHLKRARETAGLVLEAQPQPHKSDGEDTKLEVIQTPLLVEQDFGSMEGVSYVPRPPGGTKTGKDAQREISKADADFVDVESKDSMVLRSDTFLNEHLLPILHPARLNVEPVVAIVSHGIFLSVLWRQLLQRLPAKSVTYEQDLLATRGNIALERLGGWSNTGYLELKFSWRDVLQPATVATVVQDIATPAVVSSPNVLLNVASVTPTQSSAAVVSTTQTTPTISGPPPESLILTDWTLTIQAINSKTHLTGLKRTGGGVGSSRHDSSQKSIDTFFKRRKIG